MTPAELRAVHGVPECTLDDATVASLPAEAPPAPWLAECSSITWYGRGGRAAAAAAGAPANRSSALAVIGGLVSYRNTPVGPYHEAFGTVALRDGRKVCGSIPFMAVDSLSSLVGGRQNWALPKCLASFTGEPGELTMTAKGDGWQISATARPFGPRYRVPMSGRLVQAWPDGILRESALDGKARSRSAIVTVEIESDGPLPTWLRPGRHLGAILLDATFDLSVPAHSRWPNGRDTDR
jgi:hypothetical protein